MGWGKKKKVSKEYAKDVMKAMAEGEERRRLAREEEERQQAKAAHIEVAVGETAEMKEARSERMRERREKEEAAAQAKRMHDFYQQRRDADRGAAKNAKKTAAERLLTPPLEGHKAGPHNGFERTPLVDSTAVDSEGGGWSHMTGSIDLIAIRLGIQHKMTKGMKQRAEARHKALYRNAIDRSRHHSDLERLLSKAHNTGKQKEKRKKKTAEGGQDGAGGTTYESPHKVAIERERQASEDELDFGGFERPKQKWPCQKCSMLNDLTREKCELCNDSRPKVWSIRANKASRLTRREKRSDGFGRRRYMDVPSDIFQDTEGVATILENAAGRGFQVRKRGESSTSTCKCETCGGTIHVKSNWYKETKVRTQCPECISGLAEPKEVDDYQASLTEWQYQTDKAKSRYEKVVESNTMASKHPTDGGRRNCCWRCGSKKPGTESGAWLTHAPDPNPNGNVEAVGRRYRFCLKCSNAFDRIGKYRAEKTANNVHRQAMISILRDQGPGSGGSSSTRRMGSLPQISPIKTKR